MQKDQKTPSCHRRLILKFVLFQNLQSHLKTNRRQNQGAKPTPYCTKVLCATVLANTLCGWSWSTTGTFYNSICKHTVTLLYTGTLYNSTCKHTVRHCYLAPRTYFVQQYLQARCEALLSCSAHELCTTVLASTLWGTVILVYNRYFVQQY